MEREERDREIERKRERSTSFENREMIRNVLFCVLSFFSLNNIA